MCGKERIHRGYGVIRELYEKPEVNTFLLQNSFAATVPKGTFLVKRGVPPEHVIILKAGKVQISGPDCCCAVALDGEDCERVFGLYAALSGEKPELDVICTDDCDVTLVRKDIFKAAHQRNPWMNFIAAKMLGSESTTAQQILTIARRRAS
jgi:hypothetical protein